MKLRLLITAILIFVSAAGSNAIPVLSTGTDTKPAELASEPDLCPGCTYQYTYIDGVRWVVIYAPDGGMVSTYPDPE